MDVNPLSLRFAIQVQGATARNVQEKQNWSGVDTWRPRPPLPRSTMISMRLLSMSPTLSDATSATRSPAKAISRVQLLILDDWGLAPLTGEQRRDLLEIMDDRHGRGSTVVTSRLVHNAHRRLLKGESLRKRAAKALKLDAEAAA